MPNYDFSKLTEAEKSRLSELLHGGGGPNLSNTERTQLLSRLAPLKSHPPASPAPTTPEGRVLDATIDLTKAKGPLDYLKTAGKALMSVIKGGIDEELPPQMAGMLIPKGTTEKALAGMPQMQPISPDDTPFQKLTGGLSNLQAGAAQFLPGLALGSLEDPGAAAKGMVDFYPGLVKGVMDEGITAVANRPFDYALGAAPVVPKVLPKVGAGLTKAATLAETGLKKVAGYRGDVIPRLFKQARNRVKLPESKELLGEIVRADEVWHRRAGEAMEELYQHKWKKMTDAQGEALALKLEQGKAPKHEAILGKVRADAVEAGLEVGKVESYFPRVWKTDVLEAVFDDLGSLMEKLEEGSFSDKAVATIIESKSRVTKDLVNHVIESGQAKSYTEALKMLEQKAAMELFPESSFEKPRKLEMPSWVYERNAKKVLPHYIDAMTKRTAIAETWGKDGTLAQERLGRIRELDANEGTVAGTVLDMWSGQFEKHKGLRGTARKVVDAYTGFEFGTKIGLGTATIPNITQTLISTQFDLGGWNTVKGGLSLITKEGRSRVRSTGILRESMIKAYTGFEPSGIMGKFSKFAGEKSGFMAVNRGNLYLAASTFDKAAKGWYKLAQKDSMRGNWAKQRLADFGLDWQTKITEKTMLEKMYRFAVDSQLQRNVLRDPLIANTPIWRPLWLFKRFGYRQTTYVKDTLVREFKRGNPMPALRLMVSGALGGEFVVAAKNMIKGFLTGEEQYRKEDLLSFDRALNNLAAVGSFGVVSDLMDIDDMSRTWNKIKFVGAPVFIADIEQIGSAFNSVVADWEKYGDGWLATKRNVSKVLGLLGSLPRWAGKRTLTDAQKKRRMINFRGKERTKILDLILGGDAEEAKRLIILWNKHHPKNPLTSDDINSEELKQRAKRKMMNLMEAKK